MILSPAFFAKQWPQRELDGLVAREVSERTKRILPVWHDLDDTTVAQYSPTLASRLAVRTDKGLNEVIRQIEAAMGTPSVEEPDVAGRGPAPALPTTAPSHVNVPPGYERHLNYHKYRIARERAARDDSGGFTYPVMVKGRDEDIRTFTSEFTKRCGVHQTISRSSQGVGVLEFTYSGEHGPETIENIALKHRLTVVQCGTNFTL